MSAQKSAQQSSAQQLPEITLKALGVVPEKGKVAEKIFLCKIAGIVSSKKELMKPNGKDVKNRICEGSFLAITSEGEMFVSNTMFAPLALFEAMPIEGEFKAIEIYAIPSDANPQGYAFITGKAIPKADLSDLLALMD